MTGSVILGKINMNEKTEIKYPKNFVPTKKKITHLYFNDKFLKRIPDLGDVKHLLVIYLQNNEIYEITNLQNALNLTTLYLQKNRIVKIENLHNLKNLKKLYLGHNTISVVEGLENLQNLEELHLEKQYLQEGVSLCFDPRSIFGIAHCLEVLNISHNKIQTISALAPLKFLRVLNASYNDISNIAEVCHTIKDWYYLKNLSLAHNPICKNRLYQEDIIASAYCLETLDQKEISDHTRNFLKRLHKERIAQRLHKNVNLANKIPDLAKRYSSAMHKAVSISVLKQHRELYDDNEIFDEKNAVYIPWKTLPKPQSVAKLNLTKSRRKTSSQKSSDIDDVFSHFKI